MTDYNDEPDYNIRNQSRETNASYSRPKDVIGFLNPNVDTEQRDLAFHDPRRIPIEEQYEIFKGLENKKIYKEDGLSIKKRHPIFKQTMYGLTRKYDFPSCLCDCITEDESGYVRNRREDCYITELFMYCKRYQTVYNPVSALLCYLGERDRANPDGHLTGRELFVLWKEMDSTFDLPNLAIKWFARHEKIANENSFIEKKSDKDIKYSVLPEALYHKTIERIEKKYDTKINRSPIHNNSNECIDNKLEFKWKIEYNNKECAQDSDKKDNTSNELGSDQKEKEASNQAGNRVADEQNENNDKYDKYKTYEQPGPHEDDVDVDRDAVKQFVDEFAEVDPEAKDELKMHKQRVYNSFSQWAKLNNIDLDKLSEDVWINHRKGNLNSILKSEYDLNEGRYTVDGKRTDGFSGIKLSESGKELSEDT